MEYWRLIEYWRFIERSGRLSQRGVRDDLVAEIQHARDESVLAQIEDASDEQIRELNALWLRRNAA